MAATALDGKIAEGGRREKRESEISGKGNFT